MNARFDARLRSPPSGCRVATVYLVPLGSNHRESLRRLAKKYPKARVAVEVGGRSPWISRFLKEMGMEDGGGQPASRSELR